jgi:hypothetical protein
LLVKLIDHQNGVVSAEEIDRYLDALQEPKRATLARLRQTILDIIPAAEQGIFYASLPSRSMGRRSPGSRRLRII